MLKTGQFKSTHRTAVRGCGKDDDESLWGNGKIWPPPPVF